MLFLDKPIEFRIRSIACEQPFLYRNLRDIVLLEYPNAASTVVNAANEIALETSLLLLKPIHNHFTSIEIYFSNANREYERIGDITLEKVPGTADRSADRLTQYQI